MPGQAQIEMDLTERAFSAMISIMRQDGYGSQIAYMPETIWRMHHARTGDHLE